MKRPCKICWIILALFLLGNIILLGFWWFDDDQEDRRREFSKEERHQGMRQHFIRNAGIDEEQFDEMYALWKEHSKKMNSLQEYSDSLRQVLKAETFSDSPDSLEVKALFIEIADKQRQIEEANFYHYRRIRSICKTEEQREQLDKMFRSKIMDRRPQRRYKGHRGKH
ncbi:Spy/CpxP family protein refolding chaperone [Carboxylicivirga sp. RSCT41]|uniref:Spy/CpxP family protein refolding chaperone n=1 Tax=Carboxylicivirga agarovorans TaxID=3417570 RepID=UPI003D32E664